MDRNHRDIPYRRGEDPNRLESSSPEDEGKNSRVSTTTLHTDRQENPNAQSGKKVTEKEGHLKKSEIDLSYASQKKDLAGDGRKTASEGEEDAILIQSSTEAIFEEDTEPLEKTPPKGESKTSSTKERKPIPRRIKSEKSSKTGLVAKRNPPRKRTAKRAKPRIPKPIPEQVVTSKGVAYLEGNTIRMTGGIKPHPGDQLKIGEKEFVLKLRERNRKPTYLSILILLAIAVFISFQLLKGTSSGRLIGIVFEENSKVLLTDAEIQIKELGKEVNTNQLGFFMFDVVPSGSYTLQTRLKGYQMAEDNVTITKKQTTTMTVSLSPKHLAGLSGESSSGIVSEAQASGGTKTQNKYGAIRIESNVSEPMVVVDDWRLGTGNKVYQNIYIGKHTVRISKEGYQEWIQKVEVKPGKTIALKANLSAAEEGTVFSQSTKDWIALAQSQMNSHDFSEAVNSYDQALTSEPNSPGALLGRGLAYLQLNDGSRALEDLNRAAKAYRDAGDCDKAIICYTNLVALDDQDLKSFYNRGICYLKLGRYQKSISDLKKVVGLDKKSFLGYLHLGEAYYKLGDYEASIKNYNKAKKLNSHSQQVYVGLAKAYFANGKKSSAKKSYRKFKELSTYIDRERMKQDHEWRELLKGIGEKAEPEF